MTVLFVVFHLCALSLLLILKQSGPFTVIDTLSLREMNVLCKFCFAKHWLDERISCLSAVDPSFGSCCLQGKVKIDYICALLQLLHDLFFGDGKVDNVFHSNIRRYNKVFTFMSSGGSWWLDGTVFDGRGSSDV